MKVGQSEKAIKKFFDLAKSTQPSIIFLDELESLFSKRKGDNSIVQKVLKKKKKKKKKKKIFLLKKYK